MVDAAGQTEYAYDAHARVVSATRTEDAVPQTASYAYDAAGALVSQTLGNGVTQTAAYDGDGQRTGQSHSGAATASGADEDIPTLSEWGMIVLGGVLVLILIRQRRPGVPSQPINWFSMKQIGM